jgi:hypothetical protein
MGCVWEAEGRTTTLVVKKTKQMISKDLLLKPILAAAKAKGNISSVPHCSNLVEEFYRASRPTKSGKPVHIFVKILNSRNLRLDILRNKRNNTPFLLDGKRSEFTIVEDLTRPTYRRLKLLQDSWLFPR